MSAAVAINLGDALPLGDTYAPVSRLDGYCDCMGLMGALVEDFSALISCSVCLCTMADGSICSEMWSGSGAYFCTTRNLVSCMGVG